MTAGEAATTAPDKQADTGTGFGPRTGPGSGEPAGPERRCLVTRRRGPKEALLRFVVAPDGTVTPDMAAKLPGRGLYVWPRRDIVERAVAKSGFARAARCPVTVPDDLVDRVTALLTERSVNQLALARRAGDAVAGMEKVKAWLSDGRAALLVQARDGATDGRAKLSGLAKAVGIEEFTGPSAAQLGAAFGRDHVVHAALRPGGLARKVAIELTRLAGMAGAADGDRTSDQLAGKR